MKENSSTRLKHSIQKKLMAATSMLLVAVIMMVSSTYAWFTLSTAPEVTGITTTVGANGNLEIALAYVDADKNINTWENPDQISSAVNTSGDNTAWGNLIDVSKNEIYGLEKITLLPAELDVNKTDSTTIVNTSSYLKTPVYGADGRISGLTSQSVTGVYNSTEEAFYVNDTTKGVRAIGTASAMTQRQTDYRNAKASLTTNGTLAQISASNSLYNNGSDLANIILKHATGDGETYSAEELATVQNVITSLNAAVEKIGTALEDAMKGYVASAAVQNAETGKIDDTTYELIKGSLKLTNVQGTTSEGGVVTAPYTITVDSTSYTLPATWSTAYEIYTGSLADLTSAQTAVNDCPTDGSATWAQISGALRYLVDTDKVNVNGYTADQIKKDKMSELVNAVASGGVKVQLPNDSGVYSDIAALTGDYTTSITIKEVTYNSLTLENLNATMSTVVIGSGADQVATPYFTVISTEIGAAGAPAAGAADTDTKITDYYGYAIDMIFRTNASSSNLLLQTSAIDRVYSENVANEETMGGGSTMTFKTLDVATFSTDQVAKLMNAIRVVFMDEDGKVLANARLDMGTTTADDGTTTKNYEITGESVTADLLIWNEETTVVVGEENTAVDTDATKAEADAYVDSSTTDSTTGVTTKIDYTSTLNGDGTTYTVTSTTTETTPGSFQTKDKGVITALNQNEAMNVTVLVYLDGNYVDNTMVAATTTQSMTGSLNLQFASSATLVPMSNTALEQGNSSTTTDESGTVTP